MEPVSPEKRVIYLKIEKNAPDEMTLGYLVMDDTYGNFR